MEIEKKDVNFCVNQEKCIKCGMCANDCPLNLIKMDELPKLRNPDFCIECHHCYAVCPVGAISISNLDPEENKIPEINVNSDDFLNLIKSRRSVRKYKSSPLTKDTLDKLSEALTYAPTAKNKRELKFTILNSKEKFEKIIATTYEKIEAGPKKAHGFNLHAMLIAYRRIGFDRLFLKAPHMIVVSAPKDSVYGEKDAMIALSYFELLANTMGIGTLWNGIVAMLYRLVMPEIKADLEIPEDHEIQYVMLFGRPAVKYKRGVNRPNENLNFLS